MLEATTMSPDRTLDLLNSLRKATDRLVNLRGAAGPAFAIASTTSLGEMQKQIDAFKLETERVLAEAALSVARFRLGIPERTGATRWSFWWPTKHRLADYGTRWLPR